MTTVLDVKNVGKVYENGSRQVQVLSEISFSMQEGQSVAVVGPSGSGKTTLLSLCAGLDDPSTGQIELLGKPLHTLDEDRRAVLRNEEVGFVFQSFHLMPSLTALENVMLPLELAGGAGADHEARGLLERVGLADRVHHYPSELSGGERQRVAIARAFINRPRILFADEPTGNLDTETSGLIVSQLFALNRDHGTTLLLITHNDALARQTERVFHLDAGRLRETAQQAEAAAVQS